MSLLEVRELTKRFGGVIANHGVSVQIEEGEIFGLIGPNGAGKTTFFNCISGFFSPDAGSIHFAGRSIAGRSADATCRLGIARTFQITKLLKGLSVLDNVIVGALLRARDIKAARALAYQELEFTSLTDKQRQPVEVLTAAEQKRLQVTCALATKPRLLLLDEAMAGLTPNEQKEAVALVRAIRERGITILLVEHVMEVVMPLSDQVMVMNYGKKIAQDSPARIAQNPEVIKAYLGEAFHA